jgi:hypothetical protein
MLWDNGHTHYFDTYIPAVFAAESAAMANRRGVMKGKRLKSKPEDFATGVGGALRSAAKEAQKIARMHNTPL